MAEGFFYGKYLTSYSNLTGQINQQMIEALVGKDLLKKSYNPYVQ